MTVKELIAKLGREPLDAKVLIFNTNGDLYEARDTRFTWARKRNTGTYYRQTIKHDKSVVTAVEILL